MAKVVLNIRIEEEEMKILEQYCGQAGRTKTDVMREDIRKKKKLLKCPDLSSDLGAKD